MTERIIGIIMNGVTGRMGTHQHLIRSILPLRNQGGIRFPNGDVAIPDPILVGRNEAKLRSLASAHGIERYTTDLNRALDNKTDPIYFDAQTTHARFPAMREAILRGKHVYCEKPVAATLDETLELAQLADSQGVKTGVVMDKLFLPGILKLQRLVNSGFFGRVLSVRGEHGYYVFEGDWQSGQRPSWNANKEEGGGIILDMLPHWRYLFEHTFGKMNAVFCLGATQISDRVNESGERIKCTAEDTAYSMFQLDGGLTVRMDASWCVRVHRDELLEIQVDGTHGSAVAGLRGCKSQHRVNTPKPVWNPDAPNPLNFYQDWQTVPDNQEFGNAFKVQWEMFLRHVLAGEPYQYDFLEGAKGVQLAELAMQSWRERRWIDIPAIARSPRADRSLAQQDA
ncbi:MAG: Gfo/Idh/MocA family oxidoreductase [Acidobacteriota bacterium]